MRNEPRELPLRHVVAQAPRWATPIRTFRGGVGALLVASAICLIAAGTFLRSHQHAADAGARYHTKPGQRSSIQLANGSTMMLAPSTAVTVTAAGVDVDGEVDFHIVPDPSHPFVVRTRNAVVRVLGTRFMVRQYPGEPKSRVVVEDGKVALHPVGGRRQLDPETVLSSGMIAWMADSSVSVTSEISIDDVAGWTHGQLVFDGVPLSAVAVELSRAYGAEVRIADTALARASMTIRVSVNEQTLPQVLDRISFVSNAHYTQTGTTFVLASGRMATQRPQFKRFPQLERQYGR